MTRLAGRLAACGAAMLAMCAMCGQAAGAVNAPANYPPSLDSDTVPTTEKPVSAVMDDPLMQLQQRYVTLFEKYRTAVVRVNVVPQSPSPDMPAQQVIVLTGFFISRNGDILTTDAKDIQNNTLVYIDSDGVRYRADVVGADPVTSIALLHVPITPKKFAVLDLADSPEPPPIGSLLMAITSKQGQTPGPSAGMVQGYNVNIGDVHLPTLHLRVNIPDEGAEGGSPVLDLQGRLVGIMLGGLLDSHWSLVLPTRAAQRVRDDLQTHGKVVYGQLGIDIGQNSDPQTGVSVIVKSVNYGGPGLAAGLQVGDVLKSVGSTTINSDLDLRQAWFFSRPGEDLPIVVQRGGSLVHLTLHVGEMEVATPAPTEPPPKPTSTTTAPANPEATSPPSATSVPEQALVNPPPVLVPKAK